MHQKQLFKQVICDFQNFWPHKTPNFMQIDIITPKYIYYKIVQLILHYEYPTTLFFS